MLSTVSFLLVVDEIRSFRYHLGFVHRMVRRFLSTRLLYLPYFLLRVDLKCLKAGVSLSPGVHLASRSSLRFCRHPQSNQARCPLSAALLGFFCQGWRIEDAKLQIHVCYVTPRVTPSYKGVVPLCGGCVCNAVTAADSNENDVLPHGVPWCSQATDGSVKLLMQFV